MNTDHHHETDEFDRGLQYDLVTLIERRRLLRMLGGAGLLTLISCGNGAGVVTTLAGTSTTAGLGATTAATAATTAASSATTGAAVADADCEIVPQETAGPYPANGSNGPDVLSQTGVVRQDIRQSFGEASAIAEGIPLSIALTVQDQAAGCTPLVGAAVYLWHCDREGRYSLYSEGVTDQNYLRGVLETDADGTATFTSIFPACYSGRWPHIHFEVYGSLEGATTADNLLTTSQIALPEDICNEVYATEGYEQSVSNMAGVSLEGDNVFGDDGAVVQLGAIEGSVEEGLTVRLTVAV